MPDGAGGDQPPCLLHGGKASIGEIDHIDHPCPGGGPRHLDGMRMVVGQRLFAQNLLAGGQQRHRCRIVGAVRRDVGEAVERAPVQRCNQVSRNGWQYRGCRRIPSVGPGPYRPPRQDRHRRFRQKPPHAVRPFGRFPGSHALMHRLSSVPPKVAAGSSPAISVSRFHHPCGSSDRDPRLSPITRPPAGLAH